MKIPTKNKKYIGLALFLIAIVAIVAVCQNRNLITNALSRKQSVTERMSALKPYNDSTDYFNTSNANLSYALQPSLDELRNGTHNTSVVLPEYKELKQKLDAAIANGSSASSSIDKNTTNVLDLLNQIIPIADQLQTYYKNHTYTSDNYAGSDTLTAQYIPLEEQFTVAYNVLDLSINTYNNELYEEEMNQFKEENRVNEIHFVALNMTLGSMMNDIDQNGNTDTKKLENKLPSITNQLNALPLGTTPETQKLMTLYAASVKRLVGETRNYMTVNSSYSEAYNQLFEIYNATIDIANSITVTDLDEIKK